MTSSRHTSPHWPTSSVPQKPDTAVQHQRSSAALTNLEAPHKAQAIEAGDLLRAQPPAERAGVLAGLLRVLGPRDGDGSLADDPVERHLSFNGQQILPLIHCQALIRGKLGAKNK